MLVSNENRIQLLRIFANESQPRQGVAFTQAGVNKDARVFGADEG
jgi:hypothetical protein